MNVADEVNRYEQIQEALKKTYGELVAEDVKFIERPGFTSPEPTSWMRDANTVREALAAPGLIAGLAKHLFGEVED